VNLKRALFAVLVICGEFFMKGLCLFKGKNFVSSQIGKNFPILLVNNANHSVCVGFVGDLKAKEASRPLRN
jgi:hypothetical protein